MAPDDSTSLPEGCELVPGFPDYCVRPDGVVFSCFVYGSRTRRRGPWWQMKPKTHKGYLCVNLYREVGRPERRYNHQLVLLAFVGPPPAGLEGLHRNGIKADCRLGNLHYGTKAENTADAIAHGDLLVGERHHRAIYSTASVSKLREMVRAGHSLAASARAARIPYKQAWAICHGKTRHYD